MAEVADNGSFMPFCAEMVFPLSVYSTSCSIFEFQAPGFCCSIL